VEGVDFGPGSGFAWYENDFFTYAAGDWTVTETDAGATEALSDEVGGVLLLTNTATENDVLGMQLGAEAFLPLAARTSTLKLGSKLLKPRIWIGSLACATLILVSRWPLFPTASISLRTMAARASTAAAQPARLKASRLLPRLLKQIPTSHWGSR